MGELVIRDISESLIEALRRRAIGKGTSVEQYVRDILGSYARDKPVSRQELARGIRSMSPGPISPASETLIREDRQR